MDNQIFCIPEDRKGSHIFCIFIFLPIQNEKLFHELYRAYRSGRTTVDPSQNWYQGELGFFDFYVVPLAKKLEECGVFGVSSDEYLTYAMANRREWELKGKQMLQQYMSNYKV